MSLSRVALFVLVACAVPNAHASWTGPCVKDTGNTCGGMLDSSCEGGSSCVDGKCVCERDLCAIGSKCVSECRSNTAGTCATLEKINGILGLGNDSPLGNGCWTGRGPTVCNDAACECQEDFCAGNTNWGDCDITGYECGKVEGTCLPKCVQWTGQSCYIMGCTGGATCQNNECVCPAGSCMVDKSLECVETEGAGTPSSTPPPRPKSWVGYAVVGAFFLVILCMCRFCRKKKVESEAAAPLLD